MVTITTEEIDNLKNRVLTGGEISCEEAISLIQSHEELFDFLLDAAHEITLFFHSNQAHLCSLVNAKSYLCGEDCAFCAQSVRYQTGASRYELLSSDAILDAARRVEREGVKSFCIVTSGAALNEREFEHILGVVRRLKKETQLSIDGSLGFLTPERARKLKAAGMRRFNDNVQTSREFYPNIVSTHTYEQRLATLDALREEGLDLCSGGILGMGETRDDRIKMAFELKRYQPECVPINILNARPGTPLGDVPKLDPKEVAKTIAVFRFILPKSVIKLAGGREANLGAEQPLALKAGANGLVTGGYLTTSGNSFQEDRVLLEKAGYEIAED